MTHRFVEYHPECPLTADGGHRAESGTYVCPCGASQAWHRAVKYSFDGPTDTGLFVKLEDDDPHPPISAQIIGEAAAAIHNAAVAIASDPINELHRCDGCGRFYRSDTIVADHTFCQEPEDRRIVPTRLVVTTSAGEAKRRQDLQGTDPNVHYVGPLTPLYGHRFTSVYIDIPPERMTGRIEAWINREVSCRTENLRRAPP